MKRAVVTGATGVVGKALVEALAEKGLDVLVLCRPESREKIMDHKRVKVLPVGLEDLCQLAGHQDGPWDVFYHLAWQGTTGEGREDLYLQTQNIHYALRAVEAAARLGCKRFVSAGSQAEYGRTWTPLAPETPTFPQTGYGIAKLCAGQMTRRRAQQLGLEHIWVRILSVYGPGESENGLIPSLIRGLRQDQPPALTAGEQIWDYLYSGDCAQAFYLLGERGVSGSTYVLGSGQGRPLKEYLQILAKQVAPGRELTFGTLAYGPEQVMHLQGDISRLTRDTHWQPTTDFAQGIGRIVEEMGL